MLFPNLFVSNLDYVAETENKKAFRKDSRNENDEDVFQAIEEINAGDCFIFSCNGCHIISAFIWSRNYGVISLYTTK